MTRPFVFVHVPKTGGQSISAVLPPGHVAAPRGLPRRHPTALDWRVFAREQYADAFSFAIVRNPWERLHSFYHYGRRKLVALDGWFDSFETFVGWVVGGSPSPSPEWNRAQMTQSVYLLDGSGELIVDFVGRFESIERDWREVCRRIGVDERVLPRRNASGRPDASREWTRDLISDVGDYFVDDVERWGYVAPE